MFKHLYLRIWLAVLLAVAVLTLLVGWIWHLSTEPPLRDVVIRDVSGQVIGQGRPRHMHRRDDDRGEERTGASAPSGNGPEFLVRMDDGHTLLMHLPRGPQPFWAKPPFGFFWMLALVGVAVALGTYPIVRKLTRRLERLQNSVERWGNGDLDARVSVRGDDEVGFLAQRFNHAADRIQTLIRSRDELLQTQKALLASQKSLLANASHELRSPLARIRLGLELIQSDTAGPWKAEIARNIGELDQLIDEILLASRLDAQEADLGTVESVDLLGMAAEECARTQAELALDLEDTPPESLQVQGVSKLLRRVMRNLLENARRHGAGEVSLQLGLERSGGVQERADVKDGLADAWVVLRVCDRGPGVPGELVERIFEPFYRLPGATERDGGVGLGLALVKSITTRHGGTVRCEPREGGGACFVVRLPATSAPE
ncbi:MAG: hypothetical protein RLZZ591_1526 [Pseudomonadota bacterium]|jgi:signal transduction histidine kinase